MLLVRGGLCTLHSSPHLALLRMCCLPTRVKVTTLVVISALGGRQCRIVCPVCSTPCSSIDCIYHKPSNNVSVSGPARTLGWDFPVQRGRGGYHLRLRKGSRSSDLEALQQAADICHIYYMRCRGCRLTLRVSLASNFHDSWQGACPPHTCHVALGGSVPATIYSPPGPALTTNSERGLSKPSFCLFKCSLVYINADKLSS
jgi:hypothetical protein